MGQNLPLARIVRVEFTRQQIGPELVFFLSIQGKNFLMHLNGLVVTRLYRHQGLSLLRPCNEIINQHFSDLDPCCQLVPRKVTRSIEFCEVCLAARVINQYVCAAKGNG